MAGLDVIDGGIPSNRPNDNGCDGKTSSSPSSPPRLVSVLADDDDQGCRFSTPTKDTAARSDDESSSPCSSTMASSPASSSSSSSSSSNNDGISSDLTDAMLHDEIAILRAENAVLKAELEKNANTTATPEGSSSSATVTVPRREESSTSANNSQTAPTATAVVVRDKDVERCIRIMEGGSSQPRWNAVGRRVGATLVAAEGRMRERQKKFREEQIRRRHGLKMEEERKRKDEKAVIGGGVRTRGRAARHYGSQGRGPLEDLSRESRSLAGRSGTATCGDTAAQRRPSIAAQNTATPARAEYATTAGGCVSPLQNLSKTSRSLARGDGAPSNSDTSQSSNAIWKVTTQRLGTGIKNVEGRMRERQALFREREVQRMERRRLEAERERRNAAPGLGDVLMARMSSSSGRLVVHDDDDDGGRSMEKVYEEEIAEDGATEERLEGGQDAEIVDVDEATMVDTVVSTPEIEGTNDGSNRADDRSLPSDPNLPPPRRESNQMVLLESVENLERELLDGTASVQKEDDGLSCPTDIEEKKTVDDDDNTSQVVIVDSS
eukprot:CAMPEP_0181134672 /NCGR_PEP_ID=MMETSP1071-20121207/32216_1 /TAXON_ID=35127 /ORGANISM="Thalassiosira sp., Strain NH16" /LENGTH=550 /DNA_ID=CAMNT_0023221213 /DNA_START=67 /DNA_END=1719 /DNA_ORIENTATION=+